MSGEDFSREIDRVLGLNRLSRKEPVQYALADVVGAKLLSGKAPQILCALRLVPRGKQMVSAPRISGGE